MNPGPVEEAGKLAGSFIDSLKTQPLALALVVMNIGLLVLFLYVTTVVAKQREREIALLYSDQKDIRELLSRCVVPGKES